MFHQAQKILFTLFYIYIYIYIYINRNTQFKFHDIKGYLLHICSTKCFRYFHWQYFCKKVKSHFITLTSSTFTIPQATKER